MSNKNEQKEKNKILKLEQKKLRKERKISQMKPIIGKRIVEKPEKNLFKEDIVKKSKVNSVPKRDDNLIIKAPLVQRLKVFPLLLSREIRRVRWVKKIELTKKFFITVAFITFFVIFFYGIQKLLIFILQLIYIL